MKNPEQRRFQIRFGPHVLIGDLMTSTPSAEVLILHGGGNASRQKFQYLRERLVSNGIGSCAFDFIGHGETGGDLVRSSLRERTAQTRQVIDSQPIMRPLSIIGASMGAYTAVKLLQYYPVRILVLLVPAMYTSEAYGLAFNDGFTESIRMPDSWRNSDAWDILAGYPGKLMIVAAEHDQVIPAGVIESIYASAGKTEAKELIVAPNASHFVFTDLRAKDPEVFEQILKKMIDMINP